MDMIEKFPEFMKPKLSYSDTLKISPFAFAKMVFWRDCGNTEVAAYATTETNDPLLITDFRLIKQQCSSVTFDLEANDLVEDVERTLDDRLCPWKTHNILCHTHPGNCPNPSSIDEENFRKAFSHSDWAIMLIIAEDDSIYCRLKLNVGPGVEKILKVKVDFSQDFPASDHKSWETEYKEKVTKKQFLITGKEKDITWPYFEPIKPHEDMTLYDYQNKDDEICCYWDKGGCAVYYDGDDDTCYSYNPVFKKWYTEDMFDDEGGMQEMEIPQKPWVAQVIAWSEKYIDERDSLIEC